ncbi:hypothetical protein RCL_jg10287.t1 [Rhizophagus clarus]|nr:hypothetical protein RCL_jg10287.t1 [Rhizophagus clarus]
MTFINDSGKEARYLKAQFKTEESRSKALAKSASWKDQTWMILSMIILKLVIKKMWEEKNKKNIVTQQKIDLHKDSKKKDEDAIIKLSDEEVKILNEELNQVNSSCNTRMNPIVEEENELDENNKQKKN